VQVKSGSLRIVNILTAYWGTPRKLMCHLYVNDVTPTIDTVRADLVEADFAGYVAQEVPGWTPAHLVGDRARSEADPVYFVRGSGGDDDSIVGYWVAINDLPEVVIWVERFDEPIIMHEDGIGFRLYLTYSQGGATIVI
jgi:hypothetical protein